MAMTSHYLRCEDREIHFTQWGAQHAETVIAWHGLARTGRDMDELAQHLSSRYRVICPDTLGRGLSQWSPDPDREYCLDFYVRLATALVDQLGLAQFQEIPADSVPLDASGQPAAPSAAVPSSTQLNFRWQ